MINAPRAEAIFDEAARIPDRAARDAFLTAACGDDDTLRAEIEELLAHHDSDPDFVEVPAIAHAAGPRPQSEGPGSVIDRYVLVEQLGEGGFGVVYRAEQQYPVRRDVALKIIKLGMDTTEVIRRFEAERQALALMSHPNIATVLDAGATRGQFALAK